MIYVTFLLIGFAIIFAAFYALIVWDARRWERNQAKKGIDVVAHLCS